MQLPSHRVRSALLRTPCRALALKFVLLSALHAQRPTPPKDWAVDTSGASVTVTRKGGMLSSESVGTLVGPFSLAGADARSWFTSASLADAALVGQIVPAEKNEVREELIDSKRSIMTAYVVALPSGQQRYLGYRVIVPTATDGKVWLMRVTCLDALTFVRALRGGFDALKPYAVSPPAAMLSVAVRDVAVAPPLIASTGGADNPRAEETVGQRTPPPERGDDIIAGMTAGATAVPASANPSAPPATTPRGQSVPPTTPPAAGSPTVGSRAPAAVRGAANGARYITHLEYRAGGFAGVYKMIVYVLKPDGTAIEAPDQPIESFDEAAARRKDSTDFNRWVAGGRDTLFVTDYKGERETWDNHGRGVPATRGQRLNASYRSVDSFSTPDGVTSSVFVSEHYALKADGTFNTGTDVAASASSGGGSVAGGSSRSSRGTYELDGYTITFRYSDGRVLRQLFFFNSERGQQQLDVICIGGYIYFTD
jgi:hypothetical protein